jgi:hypothetical protein
METINKRIEFIWQQSGLDKTAFGQKIGAADATIGHYISGRNKPGYDSLHGILKAFPQYSAEWLILGKGSIYKKDNDDNNLKTIKELSELEQENKMLNEELHKTKSELIDLLKKWFGGGGGKNPIVAV